MHAWVLVTFLAHHLSVYLISFLSTTLAPELSSQILDTSSFLPALGGGGNFAFCFRSELVSWENAELILSDSGTWSEWHLPRTQDPFLPLGSFHTGELSVWLSACVVMLCFTFLIYKTENSTSLPAAHIWDSLFSCGFVIISLFCFEKVLTRLGLA